MREHYDIIIVGMGPSGIFCAYELSKIMPAAKILMIEKGKRIEERNCPASHGGPCLKCKPNCGIICGFSGAGAYSDGKILLYHKSSCNRSGSSENLYIGGKDNSFLKQFLSKKELMELMDYTDKIYLSFGADKNIKGVENLEEIKNYQVLAKKNGLSLVDVPIRHLGTEKSHELFYDIEKYLEPKIDMLFDEEVVDLIVLNNSAKGVITSKHGNIFANKILLAVGAGGSEWLEKLCEKYKIKTRSGNLDVGIRYELKDETMEKVNNLLYEGKFIGKFKPFKNKVRTFCQNPSGFVTPEAYDNGCTLVNGHSYKNKKSENTNLAILVSYNFSKDFKKSIEYGFSIAKKANILSNGNVILQRVGDLKNGRESTVEKIKNNKVVPTYMNAYLGDLSCVLDYRTLTNIIKFIKKMDEVVPGFGDDDNLMYGPEIKFYSNEVVVDKHFMTSIEGLYCMGAGGGMTIGLMIASCSGVQMARNIKKEEKL